MIVIPLIGGRKALGILSLCTNRPDRGGTLRKVLLSAFANLIILGMKFPPLFGL